MSNSGTPGDDPGTTAKRLALGSTELYAEWVARVQRGQGRHAAISRNINTWSSYKNWSDKVRQSWVSDVSPDPRKKQK